MNTANTIETAATYTDKIDNSFPHVLVSSLTGALVSLAAIFVMAVQTLGPIAGA